MSRPLRSNTATSQGRLLALCMVFADYQTEKDFGQVWRDRLRLQALEEMGYEVYSCDLGHSEDLGKDNRHLQANFDNVERFKKELLNRWGPDFIFSTVCFDYFWLPDAWASQRFGSGAFMRDVVPWLMDECRVKELWLPNHPMIRQLLEEARPEWEVMNDGKGLRVEFVGDPMRNPLYRATEKVDRIFKESAKEVKTNKNQCEAFVDKKQPFIRVW